MKNLYPEWLILGHLTEEEAIDMVNTAEKALNFNRISKNEAEYKRCVRMDEATVYSYENINKSEKNPNSCTCVSFSSDQLNSNRNAHAQLACLHGLVKETLFN